MAWDNVVGVLRFGNPNDPEPGIKELANQYIGIGKPLVSWGSSKDTEETIAIRFALLDLYVGSPTARAILEAATTAVKRNSETGQKILDPETGATIPVPLVIYKQANDNTITSGSVFYSNSASIDFSDVYGEKPIYYVGFDGEMKPMTLHRLLIHELIHGIEGLKDLLDPNSGEPYTNELRNYNHKDFDHQGETVEKVNQIMREMGEAAGNGRAGYDATFVLGDVLNPFAALKDIDYAPMADVDLVYGDRVDLNDEHQKLDTSQQTEPTADLLFGFKFDDFMWSGDGDDYLYGGSGWDTLYGGKGMDLLHGGDRTMPIADDGTQDTADYSQGTRGETTDGGITINFDLSASLELDNKKSIVVSNDGYGTRDHLFAIETIKGTAQDDMVVVTGGDEVFQASSYALSTGHLEVDGKGGFFSPIDTVDFTNYTGQVYTKQADGGIQVGDVTFTNFEVIKDNENAGRIGGGNSKGSSRPDISATGLDAVSVFRDILFADYFFPEGTREVYGHDGNDYLVIGPEGLKLDGGVGDDLLVGIDPTYVPASAPGVMPSTPEERLTLEGGPGNDWLFVRGGQGAIAVGGGGRDVIFNGSEKGQLWGDSRDGQGSRSPDVFLWWGDSFIMDAEEEDLLTMWGVPLRGGSNSIMGFGEAYVDASIAMDWMMWFMFYGATKSGQLLITPFWEAEKPMIVENFPFGEGYRSTLLGIPVSGDLGMVFRIYGGEDLEVRVWFAVWGHIATYVEGMWTFAKGLRWKAHDDPLVLDLDGDGIETSAFDQGGVYFDLDADFFSEKTGWVGADDGFLVWDQDGNGRIDDSSELFGSPGTGGFAELAALDENEDGVVDTADTHFAELEVWRDLNQDGRTDLGELFSLADLDITSIGAVGTEFNHTTPNGNLLREQATFTRGDGTTGQIYEAVFEADQIDTKFRGDRGVAEWVTQDPNGLINARAHGKLADLAIHMSNDVRVHRAVHDAAAAMVNADLQDLRALAEPVLDAWTVSLERTTELTPVLVRTTVDGVEFADSAVRIAA